MVCRGYVRKVGALLGASLATLQLLAPSAITGPAASNLLVVGFGLTGGVFLARRLAAAQSQPRH